jgi:hypothetical protein
MAVLSEDQFDLYTTKIEGNHFFHHYILRFISFYYLNLFMYKGIFSLTVFG